MKTRMLKMEILYAGIHRRLKDRKSPIADKLKLVKFAWKSDRVYIPNKEQVILDFLCGLLLNKKRNNLTEDDVNQIWKCFFDVLNTRKLQRNTKNGQTIIVKPSLCQVIIDRLTADLEKSGDVTDVGHVLGCAYAIVMSPYLSYIFATKFDHMINLLAVVTKLTVKVLFGKSGITKEHVNLLQKCIETYQTCQRGHPSQKQVLQSVVEKLYVPAVVLRYILRTISPDVYGLQTCMDCLMDVLEEAVFHKDHYVSYDMYLSIICGSGESKSQPPKVIENVFTLMSDCVCNKVSLTYIPAEVLQNSVSDFLPVFFEGFLKNECHGDITIAHWLFSHICSLIGLKSDSTDLCGPLKEPVVLGVISMMLQMIQKRDVYSVSQDKAADNVQLKYYRHVVDVLLKCKISPELYSCFSHLLELNHEILEPKLVDILQQCWITDTQPKDTNAVLGLDRFLAELIITYSKLRQVRRWLDKVLQTVSCGNGNGCYLFPSLFSKSFREVVQSLPQATTIDLWREFVQTVKDDYIPQLFYNEDLIWTRRLDNVINLFHMYMINMRVADYSITDITSQAVKEIMAALPTDIIKPLIDICIEQKKTELLCSILLLCHTWGDVNMLLAQHTKYKASFEDDKVEVLYHTDVSLVHGYVSKDIWKKLHICIKKSNIYKIVYLWDQLLVQCLRCVLCKQIYNGDTDGAVIQPLLNSLLQLPQDVTAEAMATTWNKTLQDITTQNYIVAKWDIIVQVMPLVATLIQDDQLQAISDFMIKIMITSFSQETTRIEDDHLSLSIVTDNFLKNSVLKEFSQLHTSIITSVFSSVSERIQPKIKSPKKRKKSKMLSLVLETLDALSDTDVQWRRDVDSDLLSHLQKLSEKVGELMLCNEETMATSIVDLYSYLKHDQTTVPRVMALCGMISYASHWHGIAFSKVIWQNSVKLNQKHVLANAVQILSCLPLSYLAAPDQLRCIYGLIAILHIAFHQQSSLDSVAGMEHKKDRRSSFCSKESLVSREPAVSCCLDLLTLLIESIGLTPVFQLLDIGSYWEWIQILYKVMQRKHKHWIAKVDLLVEISWHSVFKDYQVVLNLSKCIGMINGNLLAVGGQKKKQFDAEDGKISFLAVLKISEVLFDKLDKMINHPYLKEEVKEACKLYTQEFASGVDHMITSSRKSDLPCLPQRILLYSRMINFHLSVKSLGELDKTFVKNFMYILSQSTGLLQKAEVGDLRGVTEALSFMNAVFKNQEKLQDLFKNENSSDMWDILIHLLSKLLAVNNRDNNVSEKDVDVSLCDIAKCLLGGLDKNLKQEVHNISLQQCDNSAIHINHNHCKMCLDCDNPEEKTTFTKFENHKHLEQHLIYQGNIEKFGSEVILMQVQEVIGSLIASCGTEQFKTVINNLVENISTENLSRDIQKLRCYIYLWKQLLQYVLSEEQYDVLCHVVQSVMLNFQSVIQLLRDMNNTVLVLDIGIPVLQVVTKMLEYGSYLLSPQTAVLSLHSCQYIPLDGSVYIPSFHAVYEVLNAVLINHTNTVLDVIPAFLSCSKRLLLSVIHEGRQEKLSSDPDHAQEVVMCAQFVDRLFMLMTTHKVEFCKVAPYVVADYVTEVQKVTLLPAVKKALVPAVYKLLDICDKHSIAQLHTVLNLGVREVFKLLYSDYTKYHKYTGKV